MNKRIHKNSKFSKQTIENLEKLVAYENAKITHQKNNIQDNEGKW